MSAKKTFTELTLLCQMNCPSVQLLPVFQYLPSQISRLALSTQTFLCGSQYICWQLPTKGKRVKNAKTEN